MSKSLVIVESPAKARTIAGYLGPGFVVESSIGHIRDLPKGAASLPKGWGSSPDARRFAVDVDNDFRPFYVIDEGKQEQVAKLKKLLKEADELYLATDEDREGESIAWHLVEVLRPRVPVKRMVFHEITKKAIQQAIESPREIDRRLVDAQEGRRILDRLFGFDLSPVLWRKVRRGLSAGRVQSVAQRILVERERMRMRFKPAEYWDLEGVFAKADGAELTATLLELDGKRLASGKDFDDDGKLQRDVAVLDQAAAKALADSLAGQPFTVSSVERKPYKRSPAPPFMTSTLQQEAGRKLRLSAQRTMRLAQRLYESGYITYMRTDSTTLSESALDAARRQIAELYGDSFLPDGPRTFANKVKNAQEAHEAIRPAGDAFRTPDEVAGEVGADEARLYDLIWKRTIASQMEDARGETLAVRIGGTSKDGHTVELAVNGRSITFPGFLRAYVEGSDDPEAELETREKHLPPLEEGEALSAKGFEPQGHQTQPPPRFTEASLVRRLEELGVGRPSTYATILETIQDRGYCWKKGSALVPSFTALAVVDLLEQHFPTLVDYAFTARMEDELDAIANGDEEVVPWLRRFYFGDQAPANTNEGLKEMVESKLGEIDAAAVNRLPVGHDAEGREIVLRFGKKDGRPYIAREGETASVPDDLAPDDLTVAKAEQLLKLSSKRMLGADPATGMTVIARSGRFGPYVQLGEPTPEQEKPKTASLFKSMSLDLITLDDALKLLTLPRTIGLDPVDNEPIKATNGRYGPYIQKGKDTRSLVTEEQIFAITVDEAKALLAQPKQRGQRRISAPLRELGNDPSTGKPVVVREGRFGPYVSDGETVASLRKGDTIEEVTIERASELLADKRERGPMPKRGRRGRKAPKKAAVAAPDAPKKKAAAKKAPKKKKAKKKAAKKKKGAKAGSAAPGERPSTPSSAPSPSEAPA